ncbi:MAG: hypothetical protein PSN34_01535 [Urechidicola sp.]|nr:hypothetical protein [Urechidicola sp.]
MKLKVVIYSIIIFISLTSCKKHSFTKSDLEWQPYEIGDILIFESNRKEVDTIFITDISTYSNPEDQLGIFSDYHETLFVSGEVTLLNPKIDIFKRPYYRDGINLLKMYASEESSIKFNLAKIGDTLSYPTTNISLDSLKYKMKYSPKIKLTNINDEVVKITTKDYYFDMKFDLATFYWSKKFGYVRYDFKNNYYWTLQKFIRNDENILI